MAAKDCTEDRPDVAPYRFGPACLVLISSMIQGGTSTFLATVVSMVADVHQRSGAGGAGASGVGSVSGLAGEDALSADQRAGSTEMIDLEVPDEDNVENKTTGEPEDTSSALDSFGKEDAGLMGSESAESDTVHANKALERSMGILQGVKAFGTVVGTVMGVGLVSQNYADYGDKFMGLSVLALVMVFLSVASPETLAASSTQLRESLISEEGSSASDSAAAADDRNTASNFPVGSDSTPSKTRHEDAQSRSCAHKFCGSSVACFLTSVSSREILF